MGTRSIPAAASKSWTRGIRREDGAETLEFALLAPLALFLIFAVIYGLLAAAAQVSLAHATSMGARYATVPIDPITPIYPSETQVAGRIWQATPFFGSSNCTASVNGTNAPNSVVSVAVTCDFPNPIGTALSNFSNLLTGGKGSAFGPSIQMSAQAKGRRE